MKPLQEVNMEVNDVVGSYGSEYVADTRQAPQEQSYAQEQVAIEQTNQNTEYQESGKGQEVDYSA